MKFNYNPQRNIIESGNSDLFVEVLGKSPEKGTFFVLNIADKKVGFASNDHFSCEQTTIDETGEVSWRVSEVGCGLYKEHEFNDPYEFTEVLPYRFKDFDEQKYYMEVFIEALKNYPGIPDLSRHGEAPLLGERKPKSVEYTEGALLLAQSGCYLESKVNYKFDPNLMRVNTEISDHYLQYIGHRIDSGMHFIMCIGGKRVGFATAAHRGDNESKTLPDGTLIRRIDEVGCSVWPQKTYSSPELGKSYFCNEKEQKLFADSFLNAARNFTGRTIGSVGNMKISPDQGLCITEFTNSVKRKMQRGKYI